MKKHANDAITFGYMVLIFRLGYCLEFAYKDNNNSINICTCMFYARMN